MPAAAATTMANEVYEIVEVPITGWRRIFQGVTGGVSTDDSAMKAVTRKVVYRGTGRRVPGMHLINSPMYVTIRNGLNTMTAAEFKAKFID